MAPIPREMSGDLTVVMGSGLTIHLRAFASKIATRVGSQTIA